MNDNQYQITIKVELDDQKLPTALSWDASEAEEGGEKNIKAFLLSMFDADTKDTLKIDLWTKDFQVMEMDRFFYQTFRAVSYTHLRAHETVLDLVCRLLLEKKKKNKIYSV